MVELVKPAPDDTIIDPAMGSAGFLIEAQSYLRENHPELFLHQESLQHFNNTMFYGNDMDSNHASNRSYEYAASWCGKS